MESYTIIKSNGSSTTEEIQLTLSQLQGIYSYSILYAQKISKDFELVIVKSTDINQDTLPLLRIQQAGDYSTFRSYPLHSCDSVSAPQMFFRPEKTLFPFYNTRSSKFPPPTSSRGLVSTEDGCEYMLELVTDNLEEYKSGIILVDHILGTNQSHYIYEYNVDGTVRNSQFFSRLHGFDWYGLPKELRDIIISYLPSPWMGVSKYYYESILSLMTKGLVLGKDARRVDWLLNNKANLSSIQEKFIINFLSKASINLTVNAIINLRSKAIMEAYTKAYLLRSETCDILMLLGIATRNYGYFQYLMESLQLQDVNMNPLDLGIREFITSFMGSVSLESNETIQIMSSLILLKDLHNIYIRGSIALLEYLPDEEALDFINSYISNINFINSYISNINCDRISPIIRELIHLGGYRSLLTLVSHCEKFQTSKVLHLLLTDIMDTPFGFTREITPISKDRIRYIVLTLLHNPQVVVSKKSLLYLVEYRNKINNITEIANAAANNPSVNYYEFEKIYNIQLSKEYYTRMMVYYKDMIQKAEEMIAEYVPKSPGHGTPYINRTFI
jgi:hypothetical protein